MPNAPPETTDLGRHFAKLEEEINKRTEAAKLVA
jgi:hypothetical protein